VAKRERLLELEDLEVRFGRRGRAAVEEVSLSLYEGEAVALLGPGGAGKTALGLAVLGCAPVTDGSISFAKEDLSGRRSKELRNKLARKLQMVFQDPAAALNQRACVDDIVSEGLYNHKLYNSEKDRKAKVAAALRAVGLPPSCASRFPWELTLSQQQCVGVARALVMEPALLVADEPLVPLDVPERARILNLFRELQKQCGMACLFLSRDPAAAQLIADRTGVMCGGRLVELAETEELFHHPLHPCTRSLLSAALLPDPELEKKKKLLPYDPRSHDYGRDEPDWVEIAPGHFVYGNEGEVKEYRKEAAM